MKTVSLAQGSDEWIAHRRTTRNASEAPAMMGASPYVTRAELIRQRATGVDRDIDAATQRVFDRGHEVEPVLRALAERIIGEGVYPVTGTSDDGYIGASFDGVTIGDDVIVECKQHNASKVVCIERDEIPEADYWQIVQQFAVCESAERCLYLVGDGTDENTARLMIERERIADDIPNLIAGWKQFDADVAAWTPDTPDPARPTGRAPETLLSLSISVQGQVLASNLDAFKAQAYAVFGSINRDLRTDNDFVDAEQTVKWCQSVEDRLAATKQQILGQTASIDEVFRAIDEMSAQARSIRLELDKLVTREKESRRTELVLSGRNAVLDHLETVNATLGAHRLSIPETLASGVAAAIKGKKSLTSMRDAIDTTVANHKIDISRRAESVRANIAILAEHEEHASLFADRVLLCATKQPDDLRNLITARIADHKAREEAKIDAERERIRAEEVARLAREQAQQASSAGAPEAQQPLHGSANITGVAAGSRNDSASESVTLGSLPATLNPASNRTIKLGDINAAIAPMSITAEGLASIGFASCGQERAAKLYRADDLPRMLIVLSVRLRDQIDRVAA